MPCLCCIDVESCKLLEYRGGENAGWKWQLGTEHASLPGAGAV